MNQSLPITSIERFHLFDDYPDFPNTIGCHLHVKGSLDLELANRALRKTVVRHKLAFAVADDKFRFWHFDQRSPEQAVFEQLKPDDSIVAVPIDPIKDGGGRFLWQETEGGFRLLMVTHHASTDGQGGLQFLIDWMIAYHNLVSDQQIKRRKLDDGLLMVRNRLNVLSRDFLKRIWLQPIAIFGSAKFMARKIAGLDIESKHSDTADATLDPIDEACKTKLLSVRFTTEESESLRQIAESQQRTVNDLLLRDIFLALHEFRKDCHLHQTNEWLRIVVPISIRGYRDRRLPATNRASIIQLDRTDKDFQDAEQLAWGINYELGNIKRWQLDKTFLLALRLFSKIPGRLKTIARKPVCRATTVVTNLAAPFERLKLPVRNGKLILGDAVIEDFDLVAPLRPKTPLAIAVFKYAGQLKLSVHFHLKQIGQDDAELFVEHLVKQIDRTLTSTNR